MSDTATQTLTVLPSGVVESGIPSNEKIFYADGRIYFQSENSSSIVLYDLLGRKIFDQAIQKNKTMQIVNQNFSSGCYIAVLQNNEVNNLIVKVVVP